MPDRPANRADFQFAISYALRFDARGKARNRHSELTAQIAAEAIAEHLDRAGFIITQRPPGVAPDFGKVVERPKEE